MKSILAISIIGLIVLSLTIPLNAIHAQQDCPAPGLVEQLVMDAEKDALTARAAAQLHADAGNAEGAQQSAEDSKKAADEVNFLLDFLKSCDILSAEQLNRLYKASSDAGKAALDAADIAEDAKDDKIDRELDKALQEAFDQIIIIIVIVIIIEIVIFGVVIIIVIIIIRRP